MTKLKGDGTVEEAKDSLENKSASLNKRLDKVASRILDVIAGEKVAIGEIEVLLSLVNDKVQTASLSVRAHRGRRKAGGTRGRKPRAVRKEA